MRLISISVRVLMIALIAVLLLPAVAGSRASADAGLTFALSGATIQENASSGTEIGQLSKTSGDDDITGYSLPEGQGDNWAFSIVEDKLLTVADLDYESKSSYTVVIDATYGTDTARQSFTISVVNVNEYAPETSDTSLSVSEDESASLTLSASDGDGDTLLWSAGDPTHGSVSLTGATLTYTPDTDYFGPDSFTVAVSDGDYSDTATVSVTVTAVNDAPVNTAAPSVSGTAHNGQTLTGNIGI